MLFVTPSLLNLQEGPWIIDSLAAAQSILQQTITFLEARGYLRLCPARIFQRILFACTFLFKVRRQLSQHTSNAADFATVAQALAVGVIEHGQNKTVKLLDQAINALHHAAVDPHHIPRGFAALLSRLQAQCRPALLAESGSIDPATKKQQQGQASANGRSASHTPLPPSRGTSRPPAQQHEPQQADAQHSQHAQHPSTQPSSLSHQSQQTYHAAATPRSSAANAAVAVAAAQSANDYPFGAATAAVGADSIDLDGVSTIAADNSFGFDPSSFQLPWEWSVDVGSMDLGKEQDLLFQSLWQNHQTQDQGTGSNPLLNLFGTLVGDEFGQDG